MSVTLPPDRRFRRRRTRPVRRTRIRVHWWRALRSTAVVAALAWGGYSAASYLTTAPALAVQHVVIEGNRRLSLGEANALLDGLKGENLFTADLGRWRERLLASSWVSDAELRRRLPATVVVRVSEREPMGIARLRDELFLVDASGGIIDEFGPRYADCDLPIIDGLLVNGARGSQVDEPRGRLVADMLTDVRRKPEVAGLVSQIDVTNVSDLHVILDGDSTVLRLGDARFLDRIRSYLALASELRQRVPGIDYVDLRVDNRWSVGLVPATVALNAPAPEPPGGETGTVAAPERR